jgi:3-methyladenine DNA glycosylase AlkD
VSAAATYRAIRAALEAEARPERAEQEKRYLRSDLQHLGVSVPGLRAATLGVCRTTTLDHDGLVALAERLWREPVHELRAAAVEVLTAYVDLLGPADLPLLERLIRESRTWALSDGLSASVVGPLVEAAGTDVPTVAATLDRWAADDDFWVRRGALLSQLIALRKGRGDFARFGHYADAMLEDKEFFIRKAIGWVLRDTSRKRPDLVAAWVAPRAGRMSGLTLREATKHLPPEQRETLLAARH